MKLQAAQPEVLLLFNTMVPSKFPAEMAHVLSAKHNVSYSLQLPIQACKLAVVEVVSIAVVVVIVLVVVLIVVVVVVLVVVVAMVVVVTVVEEVEVVVVWAPLQMSLCTPSQYPTASPTVHAVPLGCRL